MRMSQALLLLVLGMVGPGGLPARAQSAGGPVGAVVNGLEQRPRSAAVLIGGQPYADVYFLADALGITAVADTATASMQLTYYGTSLSLANGATIGGETLQLMQSNGVLYAPLGPVARALGMSAALGGDGILRIESPRPFPRQVRYRETTDQLLVVLELSGAVPFAARQAGRELTLTLATSQPFAPAEVTTPTLDMRGNPKPATPPQSVKYEVGGVLGDQVVVANLAGPVIRLAVQNRYEVPAQRIYTLADPPRIVIEYSKIFEVINPRVVAPGVDYRAIRLGRQFGPVVAHCVSADLRSGLYRVAVVPAGGEAAHRRTVSQIAAQSGAIAACNGGYFAPDNGWPLGLMMCNKEWYRAPMMNRTALLILDDGQIAIGNVTFTGQVQLGAGATLRVNGLNEWLPQDGSSAVVIHTRRWGSAFTTRGSATFAVVRQGRVASVIDAKSSTQVPIPDDGFVVSAVGAQPRAAVKAAQVGAPVAVSLRLDPEVPRVRDALGGGPRLVYRGQQWVTKQVERFRPDVADSRAPRTALGLTADGRVLLVAVDGRQPGYSAGLLLEELAQLMISLGAVEAMAFDSGGSTALTVAGQVANSPSDGRERPVPNAVAILPVRGGA
ncbi:MAG TPA: phosphodiester glycosidase family protein [Armatimonadota bacterium]|nr:phosphodiester glycosidase family protein [Armatimonadota bacterium]